MISKKTIDKLIQETWQSVQRRVESGGNPLSSEKTLCFLFAFEMAHRVGSTLKIDFENQCYDGLQGKSKYLDLLFYENPDFKVAVEFKLPQRSRRGNSNQTQTRQQVYRDLARLEYLKKNEFASACYFLMATNENCYLNEGKYEKYLQFMTFHNHQVNLENEIEVEGLSLSEVTCLFEWENTTKTPKNKRVRDGSYAWLKPIRI